MSGKMTPIMIAALRVCAARHAGAGYHRIALAGGSGRTIGALIHRGMIEERMTSVGKMWTVTLAGRAAIAEHEEKAG